MIKYCLKLAGITPLNRMQIEHLAHLAGKFTARITFEHKNRLINGKSMLGLLCLGVTGEDAVILSVDGEDELEAAQQLKRLLDTGVAPPKDATDAERLMQKIKLRYADILMDNLTGFYIYGSLASDCFQWEKSDLDFLVVVKNEMPVQKKIALVETLYTLREDAPPMGFEMSVLTEEACQSVQYPIPYLLHYSARWTAEYEQDPMGFCERMHGADPDLTTHILSLHAHHQVLLGPSVARIFGTVSRRDALRAMRLDVENAEQSVHDAPVYYVLNLCRMMAYVDEGAVLSKKEGGEWAMEHLPAAHQSLIQAALNAYQAGRDMFYDRGQAEEFCYEMRRRLEAAE